MSTPFIQVGGLKWESSIFGWFVTWPFARIVVSMDLLEVRVKVPLFYSCCYTYTPDNIKLVNMNPKRSGGGLRLASEATNQPGNVIFLSDDLQTLVAALEQRGFHVENWKPYTHSF